LPDIESIQAGRDLRLRCTPIWRPPDPRRRPGIFRFQSAGRWRSCNAQGPDARSPPAY
jgi:hypothetical protein